MKLRNTVRLFRSFSFSLQYFVLCRLRYSLTWRAMLVFVSGLLEANLGVFCNPVISTSAEVYACQASFPSVNWCMVYSYYFGTSSN